MHLAGSGKQHKAEYAVQKIGFKAEIAKAVYHTEQTVGRENHSDDFQHHADCKGKEQQRNIIRHSEKAFIQQTDNSYKENHNGEQGKKTQARTSSFISRIKTLYLPYYIISAGKWNKNFIARNYDCIKISNSC